MKNKVTNILILLLFACFFQLWHNGIFGPSKEEKYFNDNRMIEKEWVEEIVDNRYIIFGIHEGVSENYQLLRQVLANYPYEKFQLVFMMDEETAALLQTYLETGDPKKLDIFQENVINTEYASIEMIDLIRFLRSSSKIIKVFGGSSDLWQLPAIKTNDNPTNKYDLFDPELPTVGILTREAAQKTKISTLLEKLIENFNLQNTKLATVGVYYDDSEYYDPHEGQIFRIDETQDLQFRVGRERLRQGKFVYYRLPETVVLENISSPLRDFPNIYDYFISIIGGTACSVT